MTPKILVVDDEPQFERLILQRFRRQRREGLFEFLFAQNGVEALKIIEEGHNLDMMLTDINMPQMDGLSLLEKTVEMRPLLKTVIVSAYGDMKNIRTAMNLGAFDFITKPIDFTDLETTLQKTLKEVDLLREVELTRALAEKNKQLEALDQFKTKFFTDISHEFRTPLTVISGMADQIEEKPDQWLPKGIKMIRRNSKNLLHLVNQILDIRKLESGTIPLNLIRADIVPYLHYLFESFESLAETQDIQLQNHIEESQLIMDYDPEKLLHIISNLLSNAIKFTPEGGHIQFKAKRLGKVLEIQVMDSGIGIEKDELTLIFDRFFQAEDLSNSNQLGTGIGLSLVKQLVNLLEGEISVESQINHGTTFKVQLPIQQKTPLTKNLLANEQTVSDSDNLEYLKKESTTQTISSLNELPVLLIIEDNPDVAQYLWACLEGHYQLEIVEDGAKGIERAIEQIPDIIVSDVMMPEKDGFEVCEHLKNDERTSHIPIVLLTAKVDVESRLSGLRSGADAYLPKPFDQIELLVRLEKLLELREKMRLRYSNMTASISEEENLPVEDQFVQKLKIIIQDKIEDETFGIFELCRSIGMSRTQLHRKVKALTGKSTSEFIRSFRLHKAKEILRNTGLNISQVAYEVGFKDPKYFSRTFTKEFGVSPNQFRK